MNYFHSSRSCANIHRFLLPNFMHFIHTAQSWSSSRNPFHPSWSHVIFHQLLILNILASSCTSSIQRSLGLPQGTLSTHHDLMSSSTSCLFWRFYWHLHALHPSSAVLVFLKGRFLLIVILCRHPPVPYSERSSIFTTSSIQRSIGLLQGTFSTHDLEPSSTSSLYWTF
jgi:hypothetical protein